MNEYLERIWRTLEPYSRARTLNEARAEWEYRGRTVYLEEPGVCEVCGKTDLRWHCQITSSATGHSFWTGNHCIELFNCVVMSEERKPLYMPESGKKLEADRRRVQRDRDRRHALDDLRKLVAIDPELEEARAFYERRDFLPTHLLARVVEAAEVHGIQLDLRRVRVKHSASVLCNLSDKTLLAIRPTVSKHWRHQMRVLGRAFPETDEAL